MASDLGREIQVNRSMYWIPYVIVIMIVAAIGRNTAAIAVLLERLGVDAVIHFFKEREALALILELGVPRSVSANTCSTTTT